MAEIAGRLTAALADRYVLEREVGHGGMATVYLARDLKHDREVALKILRPELAATLGPERFLREIKLAARLQHPHILSVYDSGEAAGQLWYTMPYVEGESLRGRLTREKQLPLEDALQIARNVLAALAYAHSHGVIHRDIKPENILLEGDEAVVADFGIARAISAAGTEHLTLTGMSVGTPAYMSPEQAAGGSELDGRSDLYSLGCVLYEMLAGEQPYTGSTPQAVIAKRVLEPVPHLRTLRESVPEAVEQAVTKALAKVPADRFRTASQFAEALMLARSAAGTTGLSAAVVRKALPRDWPLIRRFVLPVGVLLVAFAAGLLARGLHGRHPASTGPKMLAVLPFENLGDSADAYFADGVSDAVRTKLAQVASLQVIARSSSTEYRKTGKSPQQIARELGADYLLTATVRWDKVPGTASRVRVSPELVDVSSGHAPRAKWGQQFDAALTDVFQVQADIAGQVAQALNVALGDSVRHELAAKPTENLAAYDAFLRGEAASQGMSVIDPQSLRQAIAAYEQAVALDSGFVQGWAQLARAQAALYFQSTPTLLGAEASRRAAQRALAIAPARPEGHRALGDYYSDVLADNSRAYAEDSTALTLAPGNADLLSAVGADEIGLGHWEAGRRHLEQAARLDPRSLTTARRLGLVLLSTRHYPEAEQAFDHALQLAPTNLSAREARAVVDVARGDLPGARAVLRGTPREVDPTALVAFVATHQDLSWVLDEAQQQLLLRLRPSAFDNDRPQWGIVLAQTYHLHGDRAGARVYADSARLAIEKQLKEAPEDAQSHVLLGLALAYLGRKAEAVREGERGVALMPLTKDAYLGPYFQHQLVRIYLLVGESERALDRLEPLLRIPYHLSPGWLKIDPTFAPLRGNPRFERLVAGK